MTDLHGHLLLARRVNADRWGLIAGLIVTDARLIDLLGPAQLSEAPNGDQVYAYTAAYRVTGWHGTLQPDGHELADLRFFPRADLPHLPLTRLGRAALAWTA